LFGLLETAAHWPKSGFPVHLTLLFERVMRNLSVMSGKSNHYHTLGINTDADENTIKRAYRKLALQRHPDKGGTEESFKALVNAFQILSDRDRRRAFDRSLTHNAAQPTEFDRAAAHTERVRKQERYWIEEAKRRKQDWDEESIRTMKISAEAIQADMRLYELM
jgi:curved DNA-binding protein CbpA